MKIGNWNIERLKKIKEKDAILNEINLRNFDILVLTEYDERIKPKGFNYQISTESLMNVNTDNYKKTERRTTIFSKYPILNQLETFDKYTACCAELKTEYGDLVVYGTIFGIYGNRNENFKLDLKRQILDFKKITREKNICIVGDYNQTFSDNYYYTKFGRETINENFKALQIKNLTAELSENIDHISISENFIGETELKIETWNMDKKLSDHIGVSITIEN
ncbi:endonuclease/exonuclease/phosphatase family protein [Chryseobacterium sp. MP_3.2]|uniref:endonuclease/exonuclease/phosphatase family protein n=1 Tax=Chryseobacterium sp. MP_3.2 TaxID=3071712 RepID=UPI002DFB4C8A|nr:endonuclease/exonuclease/phosphatase family metal-dependent hydrolase [Chryseobacterium sp. MP_3.2]